MIRIFLGIVRRYRLPFALNLLGVATALSAFTIIVAQLIFEHRHDRCYPQSDCIFRLENLDAGDIFRYIFPRGVADDFVASSPYISSSAIMCKYFGHTAVVVDNDGTPVGFDIDLIPTTAGITDVFGFEMLGGDAHSLVRPGTILLPATMARRLFGTADAVGRSLHLPEALWGSDLHDYVVAGVYADFPDNSQVDNAAYVSVGTLLEGNYMASNFNVYVRLASADRAAAVADNFERTFDFGKCGLSAMPDISLTCVTDIYFDSAISSDGRLYRTGNRSVTLALMAIAFVVLILSVINHTNFNIALAPIRMRSVNVQKVLGCTPARLRLWMVAESVAVCLAAWLLMLPILRLAGRLPLLSFLSADVDPLHNVGLCLAVGALAVAVGVASGVYPACYATRLAPAMVLKGSFALSASGRRLRRILAWLQFASAFVFIIVAAFVWMQNDYFRRCSSTLVTDRVAVVHVSGSLAGGSRSTLESKLMAHPGIEAVAFSQEKIGSSDTYNTNSADYEGRHVRFFTILGTPDLLRVFGIAVDEGRDFAASDTASAEWSMIVKRSMKDGDLAGLALGRNFAGCRVVGVSRDVNLASLRRPQFNTCFITGGSMRLNYCNIRIAAGSSADDVVSHIRKSITSIDPSSPVDVEFYDTIINGLYRTERSLAYMVTFFSILAIIIAGIGVFGMSFLDTRFRRREIAVRRVMGAGVWEIVRLFSGSYLRLIAAAYAVALPLSLVAVDGWLSRFAYRVPLNWWVPLLALLLLTAVAMAAVVVQTLSAARENPVATLGSE